MTERSSRPSDRYNHVVYGDPLNCSGYDGWWTNDTGKWIRVSDNLNPIPPDFVIKPDQVDSGGDYFGAHGHHVGFAGASGLEYCSSELVNKAQKSGEWRDFEAKDIGTSYHLQDLVWQGFLIDNGDSHYSFTIGFVKALFDHTVHHQTLRAAYNS